MKNISKLLLSMIMAFSVLFGGIMTTGCPKAPPKEIAKASIEKAAKASFELSHLTSDAIKATKTAYEEGLITFEQKNSIAEKLIVLSKGGTAFNAIIKKAHETYAASGEVPPSEWKLLQAAFDENVLNPFLAFVASVGVSTSPKLQTAIAALRASIQIIAQVFGKTISKLDSINPYARSHVTARNYPIYFNRKEFV